MLPKDLGIFSPVEIVLDLIDNQPAIECDATIVWIIAKQQEKDKIFDTGIEFTNLKRKDAERINLVVDRIVQEMV